MRNWAWVGCFAFVWLVEVWGLSEMVVQEVRHLCWMGDNSCGGEHLPAYLHFVSSSHPIAFSPLEGYVGLWTQR